MEGRASELAQGGGPALISKHRQTLDKELLTARALASSVTADEQLGMARSVTLSAVTAYWEQCQRSAGMRWSLPALFPGIEGVPPSGAATEPGGRIGFAAASLDAADASYVLGSLYTAMMPTRLRAEFGAYYTPPALCDRLLDMATLAGVDWRTARVLDPACGGGAFLLPVAHRMAANLKDCSGKIALKNIASRLRGFELDPFAAWMSQVFLEITLRDICHAADTRLPAIVKVCNSLEQTPEAVGVDLVVGNPPYGRVKLSPALRAKFRRGLFGHANLYGVFTDLALRFAGPRGVIAYVTPTSFLAGEYFKALRGLLGREAPPVNVDFIEKRRGVFPGVLQEMLLAVYKRGAKVRLGQVNFISPKPSGSLKVTQAGSFRLPESSDRPWLMPRTKAQGDLVRSADRLSYRLSDYGYKVSTGPLVWNRHKPSLRDAPGEGRYPLIWAESVRMDGVFEFRAEQRNHKPYFEPQATEYWVVTSIPCILVQRTTAKEQCRRLVAAELPESFIEEHGSVVVENHLNMIRPIKGEPKVSPSALAILLNSDVIDQVFRCLNGSVAVSAYELEAIPLPSPNAMERIDELVTKNADRQTLERAVKLAYGGQLE